MSSCWTTCICLFKNEHWPTITPVCSQNGNSWQSAVTFHQGLRNHSSAADTTYHHPPPPSPLKLSAKVQEGTKEAHVALLQVIVIVPRPTSNPDMTYCQDLQLFTGISMTGRTGPSNSSIPAHTFPFSKWALPPPSPSKFPLHRFQGNMLPADTDVPLKSKFLGSGLWRLTCYREES